MMMIRHDSWRSLTRTTLALAAAGLVAAGCGADNGESNGDSDNDAPAESATTDTAQASTTMNSDEHEVTRSGTLTAPDSGEDPYTYDQELAPLEASMEVESMSTDDSTDVVLRVEDLLPDRGYAAHAHASECGDNGEAAGPHFQDEEDPEATPEDPSTDPDYANAENEIWLDFETDGDGDAESDTTVPFTFNDRAPESVVIHEEEETSTEPGSAGEAGDRVACLSVPFGDE